MTEAMAWETNETVEVDYRELDRIIDEEFNNDKENLIMILQAIQYQYNYLPEASLTYLAEKIGVPISQIYGVGTFYSSFSLEPKGRNIISVCLGTACYVRGGGNLWQRLQDVLHIGPRETTEDRRFTLEPVRCIGCCSLGPVVKINDDVHSRVSQEDIEKVLEAYE